MQVRRRPRETPPLPAGGDGWGQCGHCALAGAEEWLWHWEWTGEPIPCTHKQTRAHEGEDPRSGVVGHFTGHRATWQSWLTTLGQAQQAAPSGGVRAPGDKGDPYTMHSERQQGWVPRAVGLLQRDMTVRLLPPEVQTVGYQPVGLL